MRKIESIFLLLAFLCGNALTQQTVANKPAKTLTSSAVYHVTDMVDQKNNRMEAWTRQILSVDTEGNPRSHRIAKKAFDGSLSDVEISTTWLTETYFPGTSLRLRERYAVHPKYLDPDERSFGYVGYVVGQEEDITIVEGWPMFYQVEGVGSMRWIVFQVFLSDGYHWQITKDYMEGEYHFPMRESSVMSLHGEVVSHIIHARQK